MNTVKTDDRQRLVLPGGGARRVFEVRRQDENTWLLVRLAPATPAAHAVKRVKRQTHSVWSVGHPIDPAAVQRCIEEFP